MLFRSGRLFEGYRGIARNGIAGGSPDELIRETVDWLTDCYHRTGDAICGEAACQTAKAYSEMERCLKPNASQVGEALGRWPRSAEREKNVGWITEDIVHRVRHGIQGCRFYGRGHGSWIWRGNGFIGSRNKRASR